MISDLQGRLRRVGVRDEDVAELGVALHEIRTHPRRAELATALRAQVGRILEDDTVFEPTDFELGSVVGAVPLLALLDVCGDVEDHLRGRGMPADVRTATLSEIGRQTTKTRRVRGHAGFQDAAWVERVFRGGFANVERLQFELLRDDSRGEHVLNTHIPAGGQLPPDVVADSLRRGRRVMGDAYPELGPFTTAVCKSWLLDPQLQDLVPGSNLASFAALWELEDSEPGDGEVLFFVFDLPRDSGGRLAELLPRLQPRSSLQRALLDLWRAGGSIRVHRGSLPLP